MICKVVHVLMNKFGTCIYSKVAMDLVICLFIADLHVCYLYFVTFRVIQVLKVNLESKVSKDPQ